MIKILSSLALLALLAACVTYPGENLQGAAGITKAVFHFDPATGKIIDAEWVDGKEKADVGVTVDLKNGTLTYTARGVAAFDAVKFRAAVDQAQNAAQSDVARAAISAMADAILKAVVGVP